MVPQPEMPGPHEGPPVTEVVRSAAITRLSPSSARLFVASGPDKGKVLPIAPEPRSLGTGPDNDLVLVDRSVSRRHAEVLRRGDVVLVRDLGSTNGTFYHDARVTEVSVPLGSEVTFGSVRARLVPDEEMVEVRPHATPRFGPLIGADPRMREIFGLIEGIAATDATVVIEGQTGTGKELVAQAIHEHSSRARGPFVVFDCTNQPKDLVESALFGHVKGAFTGATAPRAGAFERAHKGTLFLDELGELGLDLQPKLLRVLEAREFQKVGGEGYEPVDVRVIAATNRNLKMEVRAGRFREDLYYRLAVVKIAMPSLAQRPDDLPLLVEHFLAENGRPFGVDPASYAALKAHPWPGNVRELRNLVLRAAALARGKPAVDLSRFLGDDEPAPVTPPVAADPGLHLPFKEAKGKVVSDFESQYIAGLLREHGHNISLAAREAGIDRKHFKDLMRKYGIEAKGGDDDPAERSD